MASRSQDEIDTRVLVAELRKLNLKRTQGEWTLFEDRYLIANDRTTPTVARTGTIKAKENAAFLAFLAGNVETIIFRLERLARLEKMIEEELGSSDTNSESLSAALDYIASKSRSGVSASSVEATSTRRDTPQAVARA